MTKAHIFTVGGTVQAGDGLYICRRADDELLKLCRAGSFAYVLTPRQLGKSSLMVRTAKQLAREEKNIRSVIIDLSQIGQQVTAEKWYLGLLTMIEDQLMLQKDIIRWWQEHASLGIIQRLTLFFEKVLLTEIEEPIVIFVDEIDNTLSLDFTDDFFAAIRYFYNARAHAPEFKRLSFVLIGVATPGDLIRDPQRTPFNIGQRVDLTDFTFEEALPLAAGFGLPDEESRQVLKWVLKWTGGHPYLTQRLCQALVDQGHRGWSEADVDRTVGSTFFGEKSKQDDNLQFVRDMLTKRVPPAVTVGGILSMYRSVRRGRLVPDDEQSLIKSHLKLSGVVRRENSLLRVRNLIYEEVFGEEWIQEHAPLDLKKLLLRAAAVLIVLFLVSLLPLSIYAISRAREANRQRAEAEKQRTEADEQRKEAIRQTGIAEKRRLEAEDARANAEKQRKIAEAATLEAEAQKQIALKQSQIAEEAAKSEREARQQAELAEKDAQEQRQRAEGLSKIAVSGQLGALAEMTRNQKPELLQRSILFARDSILEYRSNPSIIGYQALSQGLGLLPRHKLIYDQWWWSNDLTFSQDGRQLTYVGPTPGHLRTEYKALKFDTTEDRIILEREVPASITTSQDLRYFARFNDDKTVTVTEVAGGHEVAHLKDVIEKGRIIFSADGRHLSIVGSKNLQAWDLTSGREVLRHEVADSSGRVYTSKDREYFVISNPGENLLDVWSVADGRKISSISYESRPDDDIFGLRAIIFSPNGKYMATIVRYGPPIIGTAPIIDKVRVFETASGREIFKLDVAPRAQPIIFSPNGAYLAVMDSRTTARILETEGVRGAGGGKEITRFDFESPVWDVAFSPKDGKYLAVASLSGLTRVWEWSGEENREVARIITKTAVEKVLFSPDGRLLTGSADGKLYMWEIDDKRFVRKILRDHLNQAAFTQDGKYLVTVSEDSQELRRAPREVREDPQQADPLRAWYIRVWDTSNGREVYSPIKHDGPTGRIALSFDGRYVATINRLDVVEVWDLFTGRKVGELQDEPLPITSLNNDVFNIALSLNGKYLANSWLVSHIVEVWDVANHKKVHEVNRGDSASDLDFSPDGKYLVITSEDVYGAMILDIKTGEVKIVKHENRTTDVAFSPHGTYLATAGFDAIVISRPTDNSIVSRIEDEKYQICPEATSLVPIDEGSKKRPIYSEVNIAFSPDEKYLATGGGDKTARVWKVDSGCEIARLDHDDRVFYVAFNRDGRYLATISSDNTVRVWDVASRRELARIAEPYRMTMVAFSPDDKYLILSSRDDIATEGGRVARMVLWQTNDLLKETCDRLPLAELTADELQVYLGSELKEYLFRGSRFEACQNSR